MVTHSSILVWKIPWMEKPGGLQAMGLQRVGHDWATSLHFTYRLVIGFLPRSKRLLISWLQSPSAVILEPKIIKSVVFPLYPHLFAMWWEWWEQMPWSSFIECCFKPAFSLSSFTFIKRLFSSSMPSAIRGVSFTHLRLLTFLLAIVIPAHDSSSLAFCMMYPAYQLNKQGDNIQPCILPIYCQYTDWNQSVVPFLAVFFLDLHTSFSGGR